MSVRRRITMTMVAVTAWGVLLPGVAQAEPPTNDDFDTSVVVTELPFTQTLDTTQATRDYDDPYSCLLGYLVASVWFSYTPTEDVMLRATTAGSNYVTQVAAFTGDRGALASVPYACGTGQDATITFPARAGTTYHILVYSYRNNGGLLSFGLHTVAPAPNDNFTDAEPLVTLPSTREVDLSIASSEFDEPTSSCQSQSYRSVWYKFTPAETLQMVADADPMDEFVTAVYAGDSLLGLREVVCATAYWMRPMLFRATAGVTYYFNVSASRSFTGSQTTMSLSQAPPFVPRIDVSPEPTIYEETSFAYSESSDPFDRPLAAGQWDFGDGTTAPVNGTSTTYHHYTTDGTYQVTLTVETEDGRTGTQTVPVTVETHDVSIDNFSVPAKARTGETKAITVDVANTRYPESVTAELYKSDGSAWELVGQLTLDVPSATGRTTRFPFAYTFTAQDAVVGAVTFRAVVTLPDNVRDARPFNNELISMATSVRSSDTHLRFA